MKKQLFDQVLKAVTDKTGIDSSAILSGNRSEDVVVARYILVRVLKEYDVSSKDIADMINQSARSVNHILSVYLYKVRCNSMMRRMADAVRKQMRNNQ